MRYTRRLALATAAAAAATFLTAAAVIAANPAAASMLTRHPAAARPLAGARPALPPRIGTSAPGHLRAIAGTDSIGCYDQESIESAQNLNWVSAELGYTGALQGMLRARATAIGPWEKFALCYDYTGGYWYIVSDASGLVVSAEFGYTGPGYAMLRARASLIGPWEKYNLTCQVFPVGGGAQVSFLVIQSQVNGSYVAAELGYTGNDYAMLRARATTITNTEYYVTHTGRIGC